MLVIVLIILTSTFLSAQTAFDYPPINYASSTVKNDIESLKKKIQEAEFKLEYDEKFGYLPAILRELKIPHSSQSLVFSKTSFQKELISAKTPRAIYFNENNYVGWIPGTDILEIMSNDPKLGAIFYTLDQKPLEKPLIMRNDHDCLDCHSSARTQSVPGGMIKSRFIMRDGSLHSTVVNHRTILNHRWGSWYVSGTSPADHHLGNLRTHDEPINNIAVSNLSELFDTKRYLTDSSDIVALMVMEHQIHMSNLITRANFKTRLTLHKSELSEDTISGLHATDLENIERQLTPLIDYMLFVDEAPINGLIKGNSSFTDEFENKGPKDSENRSLYKLNLKNRLFEYPLSYMIYSESFNKLPIIAKKILVKGLKEILSGKSLEAKYKQITPERGNIILKILNETHPAF